MQLAVDSPLPVFAASWFQSPGFDSSPAPAIKAIS
ncbi:unnamed protein product [Spirodela intermedia]|uniref:Uncharacterized protein n=1 Tax=Spirodela intermedia TaxID=51605 RepID=A0A7I8L7K3_SPIIN|nr:unnamed protein product [Spirodela intermedia]